MDRPNILLLQEKNNSVWSFPLLYILKNYALQVIALNNVVCRTYMHTYVF